MTDEEQDQEQLLEEVDQVAEPEPPAAEQTPEEKAAADAAKVVDPAEFKRVQKELRAERARAKESDETARYWAEQARNGGARPPAAAAPPAEDTLDDVDLVDIITTKGAKGLGEVMGRMGYVKRSEVAQDINASRAASNSEAAVLAKYPDLADNGSPMFERTAEIWNLLRTDPHMAKSDNLMMIAARTASAELGLSVDQPRSRRREPDDDYDQELDRTERIARQSGDRGSRPSRTGPEELSQAQKTMVRKFQDATPTSTKSDMRRQRPGASASAACRAASVKRRARRREAPSQRERRAA